MTETNAISYGFDSSSVYGGSSPYSSLADSSAAPVAGGVEWVDEPRMCVSLKRDGQQCKNWSIRESNFCIGHHRQHIAEMKRLNAE